MNIITKNRTLILFSFLCLLTIGFSVFEWMVFNNSPKDSQSSFLAEQSVSTATDNFQQFVFDFTSSSTTFAEHAKTEIINGSGAKSLSYSLDQDYKFWGTTIFKEGIKWFWNGYNLDEYPKSLVTQNKSMFVSIGNENNVTYLYSIIPFFIEKDTSVVRYDVYNRVKLSQENILTIGSNLELKAENLFSSSNKYPVHFAFNGLVNNNTLASSILSTVSSDSVGQVFALDSDFIEYKKTNQAQTDLVRAFFILSFIIVIGALVISFSYRFDHWLRLLIQIIAISLSWLLTQVLFLSFDLSTTQLSSFLNEDIFQYLVNALYFSWGNFCVYNFILNRREINPKIKSRLLILSSFLISGSIGLIGIYFLQSTSEIIANTAISISDLEPIPSTLAIALYVSSYLFFTSYFILSITIFWKLLKSSNYYWLIISSSLLGFFSFLITFHYSLFQNQDSYWLLIITSLYFILVLAISVFLIKWTPSFLRSSKLRLLLFISYLATCFIYIAYTNGSTVRQDKRMQEMAFSYSVNEENEIQDIAISLLKELSVELSQFPDNAFNDNFLDQFIAKSIKPEWLRYTLSVQVINETGDRFSDYTTSLSAPQWSTAFRIQELEIPYIVEQIRRDNIRPIIRYRPINTINSKYTSFIRAWIPIFKNPTSDERIGWILCSIYEELPQLDRPLRTVLVSGENDVFGETFTSSEYENGIFVRSTITGTPLEIPGPNVLSSELTNTLNQDSILSTSFSYNNSEIKEFYLKKSDKTIVRIATKKSGLKQHIFSFLRLFFVLAILGISIMFILSRNNSWQIFGQSRRFRDRLLDRFILASIACLLVLIGSSYYVLNNQNKEDVVTTLFERLDNLSTALENDPIESINDIAELQKISSTLDVDAALYQEGMLVNSTTAQIFTQHLLPSSVPWEIYQRLINKESSEETTLVEFDDQEMVIGYKPWRDANNQIAGIAAIPTFLKAPKFYDRLLSTTSLLLAFYTFIFGFLMVIIGFISSKLTSPLEEISDGLKRISDGDLETILPVKSDDEIGMLTIAYNNMAKKLKLTLKELAKSEREAAWKEMAQQIAHEIKNPLTPMKLNLQHLERQMHKGDDTREDVKPKVAKITASMIEQIDALNQIASDFAKFSKPIEHEFQKFDLNSLVQSVFEMYEQDQNFSLKLSLSKTPLYILGAKDELRRVLVNLIKNASEALTDKGEIKVQTFGDSKREYAHLSISDNGEGISEKDQDKIFVPNFSTKSSGTGLGLAITKKIIEEHNGTISFTSVVGKSTTFTIQIPRIKK